ncbi:CAMP-regulated phosphoprotein 19-related protein, putative isoform 1 [Theobroma cacao]|uniref:cAMP-regulated phosphoprotein 19-related protein, putative isoform 1 n=2 Tax=Theobroma cacao TaxID=3641 RepID=A0A061EAA3_THECC|nr:CAMP-regulated phosphoprotein 19-related protein, putative isoform 1 [Theobroma cacao]
MEQIPDNIFSDISPPPTHPPFFLPAFQEIEVGNACLYQPDPSLVRQAFRSDLFHQQAYRQELIMHISRKFSLSYLLKAKMSQANNVEDVKQKEVVDDSEKNQVDDDKADDQKDQILGDEGGAVIQEEVKDSHENNKSPMPSALQEEEAIKKKYGGLVPRKPPLISKHHERAFFDSADWALGKQGAQKPKGPLEALRPKLQPTPHQQMRSRRSAYAPADDSEGDDGNNTTSSAEDQSCRLEGDSGDNISKEDETHDMRM